MSRHVLVILLTAILPSMWSKSFDHRVATPSHESFTWKFGEVNHLIECDNGNLDAMRKELPHFVLYLNRMGHTNGKQRLYELTDLALKMKKELHPIPIAKTEDHDVFQKYTPMSSQLNYVYFRYGEPILYNSTRFKSGTPLLSSRPLGLDAQIEMASFRTD